MRRSAVGNPCRVCGSARLRPLGRPAGTPVWLCRICRSVHAATTENRSAVYDVDYFGANYLRYRDAYLAFTRGLLGRLGAPASRTLLDCGCGPGFALQAARELGWHAVGVEPARSGAVVARQSGHVVMQGLGERLPVRPRVAGGAVVLDVLPCVEDPAATIREVWSCLAPGATVMVKTPHRPPWAYRIARLMPQGLAAGVLHLPSQTHALSRRGLTAALHNAGFRAVSVQPFRESIPLRRRITGSWRARVSLMIRLLLEAFYGRRSTLATAVRPDTHE